MPTVEPKPALLIVEDDNTALRQLRWTFDDFEVETAGDREAALAKVQNRRFPVILLDLGLPPDAGGATEGLAALTEILRHASETKVIVVTGREEREHALKAVELGAYDFFRKPVDAEEIRLLVNRALQLYRIDEENRRLSRRSDTREMLPGIVGTSDLLRGVCQLIERAATSEITVLLAGESGTGKEVLARALHDLGPKSHGPFQAINCAAIPEQLLESELFGHERGSFTGAVRTAKGRFELAGDGTLFLDEIGDMTLPLQAKLLRVIEERVMQRVGGRKDIPLRARILCATHRDLPTLISEGAFRGDLYYRLSEFTITIPPLRERPEDAVVLAHHFFERMRGEALSSLRGLAPEAVAAIARYPWPGNVREMGNRMRRAVLLAKGPRLTASDLDLPIDEKPAAPPLTLDETRRRAERSAVLRAWAEADGNISRVSKLLGVSRPTAYKLLREQELIE